MQHSQPPMNFYWEFIFLIWVGKILCKVESLMIILLYASFASLSTPSSGGIYRILQSSYTVGRISGAARSLSVFLPSFFCSANLVGHGWWVMIFFCRFLNDEVLKHILKSLIYIIIVFYNQPLLIKGIHNYFLNILDLFFDIKMENELSRKT